MPKGPQEAKIDESLKEADDYEGPYELVDDLNVPEKTPLTEHQLEWLTYVEQAFRLTGELPTYENCKAAGVVRNRTDYGSLWNSKKCRTYLSNNGVDISRINGTVLSPIQLLVINSLLDGNDKSPDHKKLERLKVSGKQFAAWKADPAFRSYFEGRVNNLLGPEGHAEVERALYDRAIEGDLNAIKFLLEYNGKYRPINGNAALDGAVLIVKIQEIFFRRLSNQPELMQLIGKDIEELANEAQLTISSGHRQLPVGDYVSGDTIDLGYSTRIEP